MIGWLGVFFFSAVGYLIYDTYKKFQYWKAKCVPSLFPYPIVGQFPDLVLTGQGKFDQKWTRKLGRKFGYFDGPTPVIEISDTDILRDIMVKDFSHFMDRRFIEGINGKVLDQNVTMLKGQHWKDVRSILVPTFTSGKMRHMNPLILDCCNNLIKKMEQLADKNEDFEAKELYGRVTLDVIASAFFATKINSQDDSENEFVSHVKKAFDFSFTNPLIFIAFVFPKLVPLAVKLGMEGIPRKTVDFFVRNTKEILRLRSENPQGNRKDFLQVMLKSLRTGNEAPAQSKGRQANGPVRAETHVKDAAVGDVEEDNSVDIVSEQITHSGESQLAHSDYKLTTEELVAQAVIFLLAGYETTATTLSFMTYNMVTNLEIQEKLRKEIDRVMGDNEQPTYDLIAQMEYLDMCVNETLRLFPPVARTERECTEDWHGHGLHLEKDTVVAIPIFAIQRDPEYWPNPDVYDPERFSYENKQNVKPYTFQTFGQGPRNCIGMRFAYYEIKLVMVSILRKFRIVPSARTEIPLQLKDAGFIYAKHGIWTKLERL